MTQKSDLSFEQKLKNYADLAVRVGVGLRPGQRLLIEAPIESAPLARELVRAAYEAGSSFVDVRWDDDAVNLLRYQMAPDGSFEQLSRWRVDAEMETVEEGGAVLAIRASNPGLLGEVDASRVSAASRALGRYRKPYSQKVMTNAVNWNLIAAPLSGWSTLIFPGASEEDAQAKHWDAIFAATRADQPDPVQAWEDHLAALKKRRDYLTAKGYQALRFRDAQSDTDLTVGLAEGHVWGGGASNGPDGGRFTPNIPTEEVWTAPHRDRVDGTVVSTKPLSYNGVLLDGIRVTFKDGKVTDFSAEKGEATLRELIETDEGAARLGEVALVPHSSPISTSGLFHYHTLYDENAASHIALGAAYRFNVRGGETMSDEEFAALGGNDSIVHVDWMIGSPTMSVTGITADGQEEPVMENGEFVI
ncbi:aminopeptidase [Deinococcus radiophilus]|uniref:Aminopeptidase n=1 Tax=Deinococcus radiophilus TaxID=32062 RepID=A0A431W0P1_9DEIO|nr:aminopeptidase [Deinococcus radiophilus]RTR29018.1 aminopeptidase [Deinococcus radiophilus]UFA49603.1 aminopeptidase [Deinococcus radiophilus]